LLKGKSNHRRSGREGLNGRNAAAKKRKGHAWFDSVMATIGDLSFLALRLLQLNAVKHDA